MALTKKDYNYPGDQDQLLQIVEALGNETRAAIHNIHGFLEMIADEPLTQSQSGNLVHCRAGLEQLVKRINDFTELASREPILLEWKTVSTHKLMPSLVDPISKLCEENGVTFHSTSEGLPEWVETDQRMLETTFHRILEERIAALRIATTGGEISIHTRWISGFLEFIVVDTGAVIMSGPTTGSIGTGDAIWLQNVSKRISKAGGKLSVIANSLEGVTVRVGFPARVPSKEIASDRGAGTLVAQGEGIVGKMKLLVAEDSDESFALFESFVRSEGHSIMRALDGEAAVDMFKNNQYDVVVMDIKMPVMDGYAATQLIREWETENALTRTPIVLLSAENSSRLTRMGAAVGCSGYLTKPTPKADVLRALRHFGSAEMRTESYH